MRGWHLQEVVCAVAKRYQAAKPEHPVEFLLAALDAETTSKDKAGDDRPSLGYFVCKLV